MNLLFYDLMLLFYNVLSGLIVKHFVVFICEKFCLSAKLIDSLSVPQIKLLPYYYLLVQLLVIFIDNHFNYKHPFSVIFCLCDVMVSDFDKVFDFYFESTIF